MHFRTKMTMRLARLAAIGAPNALPDPNGTAPGAPKCIIAQNENAIGRQVHFQAKVETHFRARNGNGNSVARQYSFPIQNGNAIGAPNAFPDQNENALGRQMHSQTAMAMRLGRKNAFPRQNGNAIGCAIRISRPKWKRAWWEPECISRQNEIRLGGQNAFSQQSGHAGGRQAHFQT